MSEEGIIREDAFYNYLTAWSQHDPLAYMASQAQIVPTPATWEAEDGGNVIITRSSQITYAQMSYYLNGRHFGYLGYAAVIPVEWVDAIHRNVNNIRLSLWSLQFVFDSYSTSRTRLVSSHFLTIRKMTDST